MTSYKCPDCGAVSNNKVLTEYTKKRALEELGRSYDGQGLPDEWTMDNADPGDSIECPLCRWESERSEWEQVDPGEGQ